MVFFASLKNPTAHCETSDSKVLSYFDMLILGRPKSLFFSRNEKIILETTFSHYLGQKQCRKTKIEKNYEYLLLVKGVQSFST